MGSRLTEQPSLETLFLVGEKGVTKALQGITLQRGKGTGFQSFCPKVTCVTLDHFSLAKASHIMSPGLKRTRIYNHLLMDGWSPYLSPTSHLPHCSLGPSSNLLCSSYAQKFLQLRFSCCYMHQYWSVWQQAQGVLEWTWWLFQNASFTCRFRNIFLFKINLSILLTK